MAKLPQLPPFDLALRYLSYRDRTEKEMRDYLEKRGVRHEAVETVIAKLKDYHYIDDERLLRRLCEQNATGKRLGRRRLKGDLKQKGFDESLTGLIDTLIDDETEHACLSYHFKQAEKRYAQDAPAKRRQKMTAYLTHRGFGYEAISPFFDRMADNDRAESHATDPDDDKLLFYFEKYYRMQSKKGYSGRELQMRISRNLAQRGYDYDVIREMVNRGLKPKDF